ncbi:hypothetical protein CGLO_16741 [Colletotrichum gloeosporioides Cg-14]|uniref:Uncharacterized protein n=1 Tax=Colletotrichum gloeosporioides (strain Cg-14) TaxID=1237896 RepID=T0JYE8_COLGC|nr:hypothetical protein CGLO_16741 [Colletotrichum gloeosporioides Cg-14]
MATVSLLCQVCAYRMLAHRSLRKTLPGSTDQVDLIIDTPDFWANFGCV